MGASTDSRVSGNTIERRWSRGPPPRAARATASTPSRCAGNCIHPLALRAFPLHPVEGDAERKPSPQGGEGLGGDSHRVGRVWVRTPRNGGRPPASTPSRCAGNCIHPLALRAVPLHPVEGDAERKPSPQGGEGLGGDSPQGGEGLGGDAAPRHLHCRAPSAVKGFHG
jgi:hypothetical protein